MLKYLRVLSLLGWRNGFRILFYRVGVRSGFFKLSDPVRDPVRTPVLSLEGRSPKQLSSSAMLPNRLRSDATRMCGGELRYFGDDYRSVGNPPDWFLNPFTDTRLDATRHWSDLAEFSRESGDIKCVWEASRFDWAPTLARAYRATGDSRFLETLVAWIQDWREANPTNLGPNWKCGQETSLRLLNTLLALHLLDAEVAAPGMPDFVADHCRRISRTLHYALAQDNNHGTSEAAALFIGGSWLENDKRASANMKQRGRRWSTSGRRWLENRVKRLIAQDGSFSQYSTNYHRLALDTLSLAEWWRRTADLAPFSTTFYQRLRAAVDWLHHLVDPRTGRTPNVGGNDGAWVFRLSEAEYADYRPSLQLASALFCDERLYEPGAWDEALSWLKLTREPHRPRERSSKVFPDGGYVVIAPHGEQTWGVVRFANFRFRPAQADVLHLDLWARGTNLLRDAGTFSYHCPEPWQSYFPGTRAHNTVEFDNTDQMTRLGRFLFGDWISMDEVGRLESADDALEWQGSYTDGRGARHRRAVRLEGLTWTVVDTLEGFARTAILRWRLAPSDWRLLEDRVESEMASIELRVDGELRRLELVDGWESPFYQRKSALPVVEVEVAPSEARVETTISIAS